jgi:hypothetical protein
MMLSQCLCWPLTKECQQCSHCLWPCNMTRQSCISCCLWWWIHLCLECFELIKSLVQANIWHHTDVFKRNWATPSQNGWHSQINLSWT